MYNHDSERQQRQKDHEKYIKHMILKQLETSDRILGHKSLNSETFSLETSITITTTTIWSTALWADTVEDRIPRTPMDVVIIIEDAAHIIMVSI